MFFGNIEAERARKGMTVIEIAEKLNCTRETYANWVNGRTPIPSTKLLKMKELFGDVTIDYLLHADK